MSTKQTIVLQTIFAVSLAGMLGSLYFSEVMNFVPCMLCWYQRIALYPIAFISFVALIRRDFSVWIYALVLAIVGALIALYQNMLIWGLIPESLKPCVEGVSCTTKYIEWLGFITIPFLSLVAFCIVIALCVYLARIRID